MKDLKQRLGFGSLLVTGIVGLFLCDRDWLPGSAMVMLGLLALAAQSEFYGMMAQSGRPVRRMLGLSLGALTLLNAWFGWVAVGSLVVGFLVTYLVVEILTRNVEGSPERIERGRLSKIPRLSLTCKGIVNAGNDNFRNYDRENHSVKWEDATQLDMLTKYEVDNPEHHEF